MDLFSSGHCDQRSSLPSSLIPHLLPAPPNLVELRPIELLSPTSTWNTAPTSCPSSTHEKPLPRYEELDGESKRFRDRNQRKKRQRISESFETDNNAKKAKLKTAIACNFCRGRKLKCDGEKNSCYNCIYFRTSTACEYAPVLRRRGAGKRQKAIKSPKAADKGAGLIDRLLHTFVFVMEISGESPKM